MSGASDEMLGTVVLGRYRIVRRLARGGMGVVYLARAEGAAGFVKPVVVKRVLPDLTGEDTMMKMFVREARILSNLRHPNIVGVLEFGEEDGAYIMVLDYVHGYHVGRWHRFVRETRGLFSVQLAIHIVVHVLDALQYAHALTRPDGKALNIIHRDVSPSNVLVDLEGHVKLVDFGIARMLGETSEFKTEDVTLKGKFPYLAPELFRGRPPTVQSDVYACGVLLHELLVGRNEFRGREMSDTLSRVLTHSATLVSAVREDAPPELDGILARALAKDPKQRFDSAGAFASALRVVRGVSEDAAQTALAQQVKRDFGPGLSQKLEVDKLEDLDAAWRTAPDTPALRVASSARPSSPSPTAGGAPSSSPPTLDGRQPADGRASVDGRQGDGSVTVVSPRSPEGAALWRRALVGGGIIAGAAAIGVAIAIVPTLFERGTPGSPSYVLVQPTSRGAAVSPPDVAAGSSASSPAAPGEAAGVQPLGARPPEAAPDPSLSDPTLAPAAGVDSPRGATRHTRPRPVDLAAPIRKKQREIEACFTTHVRAAQESPQVSYRLTVAADGGLEVVSLIPASLEGAPLGRCLIGVARSASFGAQTARVTFRVPITASSD